MNIFYNTIIFVNDIKRSRYFYEKIIGIKVEQDFNSIVFFENHLVIHDKSTIINTVFQGKANNEGAINEKDLLVYFETDNLEESFENIVRHKVEIIHPIKMQDWNQKVFRFYDPDGHIVEIGEAMHLEYLKN